MLIIFYHIFLINQDISVKIVDLHKLFNTLLKVLCDMVTVECPNFRFHIICCVSDRMIDYRAELYSSQSSIHCVRDHPELRDERCRLLFNIVLKHRYEIIILPVE